MELNSQQVAIGAVDAWLDAAPAACFALDSCTGILVSANRAAQRLLANGPDESVSAQLAEVAFTQWQAGQSAVLLALDDRRWSVRMLPAPIDGYLLVWVASSTLDVAVASALLDCLTDRVSEQVVVTDPRGRIEWINREFERGTGYTLAECVGRTPGELLQGPLTDPGAVAYMGERLRSGHGFHGVEVLNYARTGRPMWLRIAVEPVFGDDGRVQHYVGVQLDITRQRTTRSEVETLAEQFGMVKESGRLGVWSRDIGSGVGTWDDQVHRFFGYGQAEPTPDFSEVSQRIHPDDRERTVAAWQNSVESGDRGEVRFRVQAPDGSTRMLHSIWRVERDAAQRARRAFGAMIDDTASSVFARDLGELSSRLELAADLAGMGTWRYDLASGLIYWDERIFKIFGLPAHSNGMPPELVYSYAHPDDVGGALAANATALEGNAPVDTQTRFRRVDGREILVMTRRVAQRDARGKVVGIFGVLLDVTERRAAEARWRFALEGSGDGVWDWHVLDGSVIYSDRYCALLGHVPGELDANLAAWESRVHPADLPAARAALSAHLHGESEAFVSEHRLLCKDGVWRWFLHRGKAVERDARGDAVRMIGTLVDLSERKRDEARWRYALEGVGDALWEWEGRSGKVFYSDRLQIVLGHAPGELGPFLSEWENRVHPDDLPMVRRAAHAYAVGEAEKYDVEYRIRCKDGRWKWMLDRGQAVERDERGYATRMVGSLVDLTERKESERALRAAQDRIALAANAVGIGVWERDLIAGESYWDAQMYRLFGADPHDLRSPQALRTALVHPDDSARLEDLITRAALAGESRAAEFRVILPHGETRWLATRSLVTRDAQGRPITLLGVTWDITEARNAEAAMRDKAAAERANRAKSEFLSRMSHELRTPLNAILGFSQLMQVDPTSPLTATQNERLDRIHTASWHLLALINDVLDLARIEAGCVEFVREAVCLDELLAETLSMVEPQAQTCAVKIDAQAPALVAVWADRIRLRQVLLNVLSNAIKYNRKDGTVFVRYAREDDTVRISVRDTGRGIAPDRMSQLFEPFNRLGAERSGIEGTGIGLAIARRLVQDMGGDITVSSALDQGSEFVVLLRAAPCERAAAKQEIEAAAPTTTSPEVRARVVYIEDNPVNTLLVQELLGQRPGIRLETAPDGLTGVDLVKKTLPDLVLIDMQLPDIDGDEVFRRLRRDAATARIPCIALSANAMSNDIEAARSMGFNDYWTKPIDVAAFLSDIDAFFDL